MTFRRGYVPSFLSFSFCVASLRVFQRKSPFLQSIFSSYTHDWSYADIVRPYTEFYTIAMVLTYGKG